MCSAIHGQGSAGGIARVWTSGSGAFSPDDDVEPMTGGRNVVKPEHGPVENEGADD
jgi:hypothetical protein